MSRLVAALEELTADLLEAGVRASLVRSEVNTPGAWVNPETVDITTLDGSGTCGVDVFLVVGDVGALASLTALDGLLDKLLAAGIYPTEPIDTSYALVLTGPPLPAFRVRVTIDL